MAEKIKASETIEPACDILKQAIDLYEEAVGLKCWCEAHVPCIRCEKVIKARKLVKKAQKVQKG